MPWYSTIVAYKWPSSLSPEIATTPFEVAVTGIVVAGIVVGISYMGPYSETVVPSKIVAEMGIEVHPETGE